MNNIFQGRALRVLEISVSLLMLLVNHHVVYAQANQLLRVSIKGGRIVEVDRETKVGPTEDGSQVHRPGSFELQSSPGTQVEEWGMPGQNRPQIELPGLPGPARKFDQCNTKCDGESVSAKGVSPGDLQIRPNAVTADLYVQSVEVLDGIGPAVKYRYTIGNNGPDPVSTAFENHIYLSTNSTISSSDYLIDKWSSGSTVPAGGSYTSTTLTSTVSGVPDGTYYLGVITDGAGALTETNESNNTGYDSSPQVKINTSGTFDLYVASVVVVDETGPGIKYRYTIGNNGTAVVSTGFENCIYLSTNTTISAADYLIDSWTSSSTVPAGGSYTSSELASTVSGVPDGAYYLGVVADGTGIVEESNETNNTGYDNSPQVSIFTTDNYDLYVDSVTVVYQLAADVMYSFIVGNKGADTVRTGFYVGVYLSTNTTITTGDHKIGDWRTSIFYLPGARQTFSYCHNSTLEVPDGTYYLGVMVDEYGSIAETDEGNNTGCDASFPMHIVNSDRYDLYVSSVEVLNVAGPDISYRFKIGNGGPGNLTLTFANRVYLSPTTTIAEDDYLIDSKTYVDGISAGGIVTSPDYLCSIHSIPDGSYYLGVIADATNAVAETNEDNNAGHAGSPQVAVSLSSLGGTSGSLPTAFELLPNFPNPFNPTTTIRYAIPHRAYVTLFVYNSLGQQIRTLVNDVIDAGYHSLQFDGSNLGSGVYFCRLSVAPTAPRDMVPTDGRDGQADNFSDTKKLLLVK